MIDTLDELMKALASRLEDTGTDFSERRLAAEMRACRDEIYADTLAHDGRIEDPFFNLIVIDSVAVFAFFDEPFDFYIFHCDEREVITKESELAMVEVEPCRQFLRDQYGREQPDVSIPRWLAETWMEQC